MNSRKLIHAVLAVVIAGHCVWGQDSAEAHLGKGYDALKQERYEEAASEFRAALRLDPSLVTRARFPLAVALFELKQSVAARREFAAVRRETGDHPNIFYYLGRLDLLDQDFASAIKNLTHAAVKPPFPDTAYHLGLAYFKSGDLKGAEKWLKTALEMNARDSLASYQLALVYRKEGREDEAKKTMALSADIRRQDVEESQIQSECKEKLDHGPREAARAVCERLYDPNNAEKLTTLGTLYGQHGDLEAALDPLRRAAELAPQAPQMQYNLAFTYYRLKRFEEARTPLARAVERWPDIFQLSQLYGAVLLQLGELLPAHAALHRAHELNPKDAATGNLLYVTLFQLAAKRRTDRQYPDALRYLDEAVKLRPDDPQPHFAEASLYELTGEPEKAAAERQEAERLRKVGGAGR